MNSNSNPRVQRLHFTAFDSGQEKPAPASKAEPVLKAESAVKMQPALKTQPESSPEPPPLPLVLPAITEKEVQQARVEGLAQGNREGYAAAQAKFDMQGAAREEALKSLLEVIANRITLAAEQHSEHQAEREALMSKLVIAGARKVAGDALKREPYGAVESLVRESMALIAGVPKVTVVVSSALAPGLRQRIDMLKPSLMGFSGELVVEEDSALMDQDCRVEWGKGAAERNAENLWSAIEAIVTKTTTNV